MLAYRDPKTLTKFIREQRASGRTIGLVPTMGALHDGHLALMDASIQSCDVTVVSLFVNPLQFNNSEDLKNYPRDLEKDKMALSEKGIDVLFHPSEELMFPTKPLISIDFGGMDSVLEGAHRPGHFKGVGVVVSKLFHIVEPDKAFFGLKDLQQYLLINRMVDDLSSPIEVVGINTVRDENGLALSSRNQLLTNKGKDTACHIFRGLELARKLIDRRSKPREVVDRVMELYAEEPDMQVEYLEFVDARTLQSVDSYPVHEEIAVCVAGFVEGVRLIDNLYLRGQNKR